MYNGQKECKNGRQLAKKFVFGILFTHTIFHVGLNFFQSAANL